MQSVEEASNRHLKMLETAFGKTVMQLLQRDDVIEVMLNPDGKVWVDSLEHGKYDADLSINSVQAHNIIKLVATYQDTSVDSNRPELSCELPGSGERFQGWLPPVVSQPCFAIRKKALKILSLDDYYQQGGLSWEHYQQLVQAVKDHLNIIVAGGTSSGKTTFANALLNELKGTNDRLLVLEDLPELQVSAPDTVKLRTSTEKSMRHLVRGVLRMRPDRIIIGEVRDGAALDMLKAWNTGHPGGICTIHANSAEAVVARLEDLIREVVASVPRRLIEQAIDLVVFMERNREGQHCVKDIMEMSEQHDPSY